ncbi:MAG: extracellular solute-binding protein [Phycisphaeraceae bacterium]|nr:extracellular solute-binding protein [Phycisphaeraceae bacterium]
MNSPRRSSLNRREFLTASATAIAAGSLWSCHRAPAGGPGEVILYSSADPEVLSLIVSPFERATSIKVRSVGDTEATKTTGLVQRLIAEKGSPRADVWWSSEAMGTVQLSNAGILEPYRSEANERDFPGAGWPAALRGHAGNWYGFASRDRVIVYHTGRTRPGDIGPDLFAIASPAFKGRIGIARPQFGTTRGHVAAIMALHGEETLSRLGASLKDNGVRLYDGNMSVVRAAAAGEIDIGWTDSDDVFAGQRNGWPIDAVPAHINLAGADAAATPTGVMATPNTAAIVRAGPNPANARRLLDFLISAAGERLLAESDSHNIPARPALAAEFAKYSFGPPAPVPWDKAAQCAATAMDVMDKSIGQ